MSSEGAVQFSTGLGEGQEQPRITAEKAESLPRRIASGPVVTPLGQYEAMEWSGVNTSGMKPWGDSILVLPDQPRERTTGGIFLSEQEVERMAYAAETGVIVAIGDGAFAWNADRTRPFQGEKPAPGVRIWFERYSGAVQHGRDGLIYRLMTDKQMGAIAMDEAPEAVAEAPAPAAEPIKMAHTNINDPPPAAPKAKPKQAPVEPPPWPRYLKKDGNMLMAYDHADANAKAPGEIWWHTRDLAEMRGT